MISDNGFELHIRERDLLLVNRKTWGQSYAMLSLGLTSVFALAFGALMSLGAVKADSDVVGFVLVGIGLLLLAPIPFLIRTIRQRAALELSEVPEMLVLDLVSKELRDRMGVFLAHIDDVEAALQIDWLTRGWGRVVVLRWQGESRTIFRTFRWRRGRSVIEALRDHGVPTR